MSAPLDEQIARVIERLGPTTDGEVIRRSGSGEPRLAAAARLAAVAAEARSTGAGRGGRLLGARLPPAAQRNRLSGVAPVPAFDGRELGSPRRQHLGDAHLPARALIGLGAGARPRRSPALSWPSTTVRRVSSPWTVSVRPPPDCRGCARRRRRTRFERSSRAPSRSISSPACWTTWKEACASFSTTR